MSKVFLLEAGDGIQVRVRQEPHGCIAIDSKGHFVEGNQSYYKFLCFLRDGLSPNKIIERIHNEFGVDLESAKEDFNKFLEE